MMKVYDTPSIKKAPDTFLMCVQFMSAKTLAQLADEYQAEVVKDFEWKPHVFPRYLAPVIIERKGVRQVVPMHFGLIPSFEMNAKPKMVFHNARSETIKEKPSFKKAYQESRCLIPLQSFFEYVWETDPATGKEKSRLMQFFEKQAGGVLGAESALSHSSDGAGGGEDGGSADAASIKKAPDTFLRSLTAAGVWSLWRNPETGVVSANFSMITREPPEFIERAGHDRCPYFIRPESISGWLDPQKKNPLELDQFLFSARANIDFSSK
jgi:putative SOS response-associated peptidase YedK